MNNTPDSLPGAPADEDGVPTPLSLDVDLDVELTQSQWSTLAIALVLSVVILVGLVAAFPAVMMLVLNVVTMTFLLVLFGCLLAGSLSAIISGLISYRASRQLALCEESLSTA